MQIKLMAIFAFVLFMLVVLLVRITVITAKSGNQYARQVLSQQSYDSQTIPYRRGEIQDANGIILARSERVYNVVLDCYASTAMRIISSLPSRRCAPLWSWMRRMCGTGLKTRPPGTVSIR